MRWNEAWRSAVSAMIVAETGAAASVQRRTCTMLGWPRAERRASRLPTNVDLEDLHDQIENLRAYVHDLSESVSHRASRKLGRARHLATEAAHEAEEAMKDNLAASLVLALALGLVVGYFIR